MNDHPTQIIREVPTPPRPVRPAGERGDRRAIAAVVGIIVVLVALLAASAGGSDDPAASSPTVPSTTISDGDPSTTLSLSNPGDEAVASALTRVDANLFVWSATSGSIAPGATVSIQVSFDLDADGTLEEVPWASGGGAFLALDRNGNGVIDDGSELFGPTTGNGFAELAALDEDGDSWIDEDDAAWARLRLVTGSTRVADTASLADADVGAIAVTVRQVDLAI